MEQFLSISAVLALASLLPFVAASFSFEFQLQSVSTRGNCLGDDLSAGCETYLAIFCLRSGPRFDESTSTTDCSLGASGRFGPDGNLPITRVIPSTSPWTESFQMFIRARDEDEPVGNDDDIDDIFINSFLQANSGYTSFRDYTGSKNKVTVRMRFRVRCDSNYYGQSCSTFCVERDDDINGHYTCNNDGSIRCRSGYEHPENNCRDEITACSSSPCQQGAPCSPIGLDDYSCDCPPGYSGKDCGMEIDECDPNPCQNNGTCIDAVASYRCNCHPGFNGSDCEVDVDECEDVDCPGNSTCVDRVNSYSCVCNDGFEGENCTEIDPCAAIPCNDGCICVSFDPFSYMCQCPDTSSSTTTSNVEAVSSGPGPVMIAVGAVVGILIVMILVVFIVMTALCVLRKKGRKTVYDTPEHSPTSSTVGLKSHDPTSEDHIYQIANGTIYQDIPTVEQRVTSDYEGAEVINPLYGSNPPSPLHDRMAPLPPGAQLTQPTSLTMESAKSTDTLHDVANPLYGDTSPSYGPSSPQGPIYSVPRPASVEAKKEVESYPYSYARTGSIKSSLRKPNGSVHVNQEPPSSISNNYEYIKMGSAEPLSPSLAVANQPARVSVYDDNFHYEVINVKNVDPPSHYQEPEQKDGASEESSVTNKQKPALAPKPNLKNGTISNHRTNGSIKVKQEDNFDTPDDKVDSYDRLDHGTESTPPTGMTVRLAKLEGSGYEALQS